MKKTILFYFLLTACAQSPLQSNEKKTSAVTPASIYTSAIAARGIDFAAPLDTLAFGSCANQDQPAPLWKTIDATNPDLFLFLGDNIYASHPTQKPIADQYRKLDLIPEYRALREKVPFMATWDDHDYGSRDGGADWLGKDEARRDFLNYWSYLRHSLPHEQGGIYHSKIIGPPKKMVQIIMLDTRYFRSPLKERPGNEGKAYDYLQQSEGTILGEAQWKWLEAQLKKPAQIRFIISSIQLVANEPKYEKWDNFPNERQRFFDLLEKAHAKNVVVLSGDRHLASIAKVDLKGYGPLYDITSSSINRANNFDDKDSHYVGSIYNKENFGLAQIDWKNKKLKLQIRNIDNEVVNSVEIKIK